VENGRGKSWIDSFVEQTADTASPLIFRKWAGISAVAGALERKIWIISRGTALFPNLYIMLIGPPGVGKSIILARVNNLWSFLQDHHKGSSSLTRASFIDELDDAKRHQLFTQEGTGYDNFNALTAAISEMGVLLPAYEHAFMSTLTDIYDGTPYSEKRRTKDLSITIERPFFNIICGTTPSYLGKFMPEGAWDQGFISRNIMVYSGVSQPRNPFESPTATDLTGLIKDLRLISTKKGELKFSKEASAALINWTMAGGPPAPDHPRLASYLPRRTAHLLKLCIISSIAWGASQTIEIEHYQIALDWLLEAELLMPDIFRAMLKGGDSQALEDCWHFMWKMSGRTGQPVMESVATLFLAERVPAHNVERLLQLLVRTGHCEHLITPSGHRAYKPLPRPPGY
jgi:Protein of unknown function (DUF3987)